MSMCILSDINSVVKQLEHFHTFDAYPLWMNCPGVLSFARTSPRNQQPKYSHDAQQNQLREAIYLYDGWEPKFHIDEIGVHGHRINPGDRKGLAHAVSVAFQNNYPICVWDWSRLTRKPELLVGLDHWGVEFVCLQPLTKSQIELHGMRIRQALREKQRQEQLGQGNRELGQVLSRYMDFGENYEEP